MRNLYRLVYAIRTAYLGDSFIYPFIAEPSFGEMTYQHEIVKIHNQHKEVRLTFREIDVVKLICQGLSNQEIAERLFLSEKTVRNHLANIFRKLRVSDRTQTVLYVIKNKIVTLD